MEKSAKTISFRKFARLSSRRQHELLAGLARSARETGQYGAFLSRYGELSGAVSLDRYTPPHWLTAQEALCEYEQFHRIMGTPPAEQGLPANGEEAVSWEPSFAVDIVLDGVRSPYNVGSLLRIIDNFGLRSMVHCAPWLRLDHPQLIRAARGCQRWIPVRYESDLLSYLHKSTIPVIAIENDERSIPVGQWIPPESCMLVAGNEACGIAAAVRSCCAEAVCIPLFGYKRSMNVQNACAVIAQRFAEHASRLSAADKRED
jgi:tRNA(Leu) C34 or U34 (ribose-2'-O)-methylase TrmL